MTLGSAASPASVTKAGCRRQGIATALLAGALGRARESGARVLGLSAL
jgi:ribosomal protein S18 acetylase RimI-like enzyme